MSSNRDLRDRRHEAVQAWTAFVELGDRAGDRVRPEIRDSWRLSTASVTPDLTEAPLDDESDTAAYWRQSPLQTASGGWRPSCGARPRTVTWSSRSPTPRPASCGRTAGG